MPLPPIYSRPAWTCGRSRNSWVTPRISTTQRYTHLDLAQVMRVYDACHPLAGGKAGDES